MLARFYFSHDRATRWRLLAAVALATVLLAYRLHWANTDVSTWATRYFGYYLVTLTSVIFALVLREEIRAHWPGWKQLLRAHWPGLLCAALVAIFWQLHEPHDFKVLFDEHVLGGIARKMHFDREGAYDSYAHYSNGHIFTMGPGVDKRPLMFPFLVSVVHDLTGFRPENSFVVNGIISFVLLVLVYGMGSALGGWRIGCLGQLLLAGLPLVAQNATGGGFDLLNTTMVTGFLLASWNYWRQPGTGGLDLAALTGVVLVNCRYESMVYLLALAALAGLKWVREGKISLTLTAALSPALITPPMLINQIFLAGGRGAFFQTSSLNDFLNIKFVPQNLVHAAMFLFTPDFFGLQGDTDNFHSNNSFILSILGFVALLFVLVGIVRRLLKLWREPVMELPLLLILGGVLLTTFISMLSFWGHWDQPVVVRLSLPFHLALIWSVMFVTARWLKSRLLPNWVLGTLAILAVVFATPTSANAFMTEDHQTYTAYGWARDYVRAHADNSVLIVSRSSVMFTLYGQPNVHMGIANRVPLKVADTVRLGLYREVWIIQDYILNTRLNAWVELPAARLDQRLRVKPMVEFACRNDYHIRISKLIGYDGTKPPGTVVLQSELTGDTEAIREGLGGDYAAPTATDNLLTERPADEPAALPMLTDVPTDPQDVAIFLSKQYP